VSVSPEALAVLAGWADEIDTPGFAAGTWDGGTADASGVIHMPYVVYPDRVHAFTADLARAGLVHPVDWMTWAGTPRGVALLRDPSAVAGATAEELALLLTTIVRSERFGDGEIEAAFERGVVQAAARRAQVLLDKR
jgi:hypothetical protein